MTAEFYDNYDSDDVDDAANVVVVDDNGDDNAVSDVVVVVGGAENDDVDAVENLKKSFDYNTDRPFYQAIDM